MFPLDHQFTVPFEYQRIMELKYEQVDHQDLQNITDYIPFPKTKNSKYVEGMLSIYGGDD